MKLKQKNLLLFLGGSAGAMSAPQATNRQSLCASIAFALDEAITSSALMPHTLPCHSQSLLFILAGQSFQVVRALSSIKTADLTLIQQIEYRTHEAVADLMPHQTLLNRGQIR